MKRTIILTVFAALLALSAQAQSLSQNPAGNAVQPVSAAPCVLGANSITQSDDCSITTGITCIDPTSGATADTSYLRRFFLAADHGVVTPYVVTSVDFGVQIDVPAPSPPFNPITVSLYKIPIGADFLFANMTLLGSTTFDLGGDADLSLVNAVVGGAVDPSTDDLVVEVRSFDHMASGTGGRFDGGANGLGQTRPSYLAAPDCGLLEPTDLAGIGFPDNHHVMVVNGGMELKIDHKPGSNPNCGRSNRGVTTVAVFGSPDFDPALVDVTTVEFGGAEAKRCSLEDALMEGPTGVFTQDGIIDLVCKFRKNEVGWPAAGQDCIEIGLTGELLDGTPFVGYDHACVAGDPTCEAGDPIPLP